MMVDRMNMEGKKILAVLAVLAMAFAAVVFVNNSDESDATTYTPYSEGAVTVYADQAAYDAQTGTDCTLKYALENQADGQIWVFKEGDYNVTHTSIGVQVSEGVFDYGTYSSDPSAINAGSLLVIKNAITLIGAVNDGEPATTLYSDYASLGYADRATIKGGYMDNGVFTANDLIYIKGTKDVTIKNMVLMPLVYLSNKYSGTMGIPSNADTRWFTPNVTITSNATSLTLENIDIVKNSKGTKDSTNADKLAYMMNDAGNSQQMTAGTWNVTNVSTDGGFGLNKANITINMTDVTMNVGGTDVGDQRSIKFKTGSYTVTLGTFENVVINIDTITNGKSSALNELKTNLFDASINPQLTDKDVTVNILCDVEFDANITIPSGVTVVNKGNLTEKDGSDVTITNNGTLVNDVSVGGTISGDLTLSGSGSKGLFIPSHSVSYDATQSFTVTDFATGFGTATVDLVYSTGSANAGDYTYKATSPGSTQYSATADGYTIVGGEVFTINKIASAITVTASQSFDYNGSAPEIATTGKVGTGDVSFAYYAASEGGEAISAPVNAGTWYVTATVAADDNHTAFTTARVAYSIAPLSIAGATVTLGDALTYNGSEQTQGVDAIKVSTVNYKIQEGLAVSDNVQTNVKTDGNYTLTITGSGNFTGSTTANWNIAPLDVSTLAVTIKNGETTISPGERIAYDEEGYTLTYAVDGYASPATIASKWQIKNGETWTDTDTIKNSGEYQLVLTGSANFTGTLNVAGPVIAEAKEVEYVDETTHKTTEDATITADTDSVSISNDSEFTVGDDKKVEINLQTTYGDSGSDGKAKIEFPEGTVFNEGNESSVISLVNVTPADPESAPTFEIVFENVTVESVTITLPVGTGLTNPAVYYVPGGSAEKVLMGGTYDAEAGTITFVTTHNSTYEVQQSESPMTHDVTITAGTGGDVDVYSIPGVPDGAAITVDGNELTIGEVTVTATADLGYNFSNWTGVPTPAEVTTDLVITANFTSTPGPGPGPRPSPTITYTLTFEAGSGGSVSPTTTKAALNANISVSGDTMIIGTGTSAKTVKAIPNDGYTVGTWSVTSGKVTSDMTISVTFKKVSLIEISVKNAPTKVSYKEGEKFDPAGLSIMLKYDDMTFKVLPYKGNESQFSFSPSLATPLKTSDKTVTITLEGKSTTQAITVTGDSPSGGNDNTVLYVVIAAIVVIFAAGAVFYFVKKKPAE